MEQRTVLTQIMSENNELIIDFVHDCKELVDDLELSIISLNEDYDKGVDITETINSIFRGFHSIKGGAGFLMLNKIKSVSHVSENLLDLIRSHRIKFKKEHIELFVLASDFLKEAIDIVHQEYCDDSLEDRAILINNVLNMAIKDSQESNKNDTPNKIALLDIDSISTDTVIFEQENTYRVGDILKERGVISDNDIDKALAIQRKPIGELLVDLGAAKNEDVTRALKEQQNTTDKTGINSGSIKSQKRQDIRVDIGKLDGLINQIGELVIAQNMIVHSPDLKGLSLENFNKASQQMGKIVRDLQDTAMVIRMIPISGLFKRMIRLVHDVSIKSGKKVDLKLIGEETEIDKTIIELITDPMVHILRNAIDHGIESPKEREKADKPSKGIVTLTAKHEDSEVWIIIEDDGQGMNRDKILNRAVERGLVSENTDDLSDKEVYSFVFHPGFSTAEKITDISGRGVGMDVVKKNMEKIKGRVDIQSNKGIGTKVILRIPLTLAILEGMRVRVGNSEYIVPLLSIREFIKPVKEQITISTDETEIVKLRNELLPVVRLHKLHSIAPDSEALTDGILLILESSKRTIALLVDEIMGQQQTVIKGLSEYIGKVKGVSGCTILGNGAISLILDVDNLL